MVNVSDEPPENENGPTIDSHGSNNWLLLLCMAFNDGDDGTCLQREHFDQLQQHQKVMYVLVNLNLDIKNFLKAITFTRIPNPVGDEKCTSTANLILSCEKNLVCCAG